MTSTPGYFASTAPASAVPAPTASAPRPRRTGWRIAVVALATAIACPAAALAAFAATITWSGCFFSCSATPDHLGGGLLGLLAMFLLLAGPILAWLLFRSGRAVAWAFLSLIVAPALGVLPFVSH